MTSWPNLSTYYGIGSLRPSWSLDGYYADPMATNRRPVKSIGRTRWALYIYIYVCVYVEFPTSFGTSPTTFPSRWFLVIGCLTIHDLNHKRAQRVVHWFRGNPLLNYFLGGGKNSFKIASRLETPHVSYGWKFTHRPQLTWRNVILWLILWSLCFYPILPNFDVHNYVGRRR